jgi:hypothetical protein
MPLISTEFWVGSLGAGVFAARRPSVITQAGVRRYCLRRLEGAVIYRYIAATDTAAERTASGVEGRTFMAAETDAIISQIKQSLELLRRHL